MAGGRPWRVAQSTDAGRVRERTFSTFTKALAYATHNAMLGPIGRQLWLTNDGQNYGWVQHIEGWRVVVRFEDNARRQLADELVTEKMKEAS